MVLKVSSDFSQCVYILQIVYSGKELNHPFGLSHHGNYVFWTDYMNGSIFQLDLIRNEVTLLRRERPPLFGLQIYDPRKQQGIKNQMKLHLSFTYNSTLQRLHKDFILTVLLKFYDQRCLVTPKSIKS